MPILPNPNQSSTPGIGSTVTLQQIANAFRAYPDLKPLLTAGGWTQEPTLTIANDVAQKFFAQTMDWKFNRANVPPFLTVSYQQDYVTNVTNIGWLEQAWRVDINNLTIPKPIFSMESVRDLGQTSFQGTPFNVSWVPNQLAIMGQWYANTTYTSGYLFNQTQPSPITQFVDVNGNILFIDSSSLGLSINSPGFQGGTGTVQAPYGTTGSSKPAAASGSAPGTQVQDGSVTWTVADPNGFAMRMTPLPAYSGLTWLVMPVYQKTPPVFTSLQQTIAPIPDYYAYLFRQGFLAAAYDHAGSPKAGTAYAKWEEALQLALRGADREREEATMYPSDSLTGGMTTGYPLGPAWPFGYPE